MSVIDLFSGPGGWCCAAQQLGLDPIGIEHDADACATRAAAGLTTIRADLNTYELADSVRLDGLIGSPPCPMFSYAGKKEGAGWLPHLCEVAAGITALNPDAPAEAALSLKPLEWALKHRPRWVCLEQVPGVVLLWGAVAGRLRAEGYSTWTGVLNAADYGVPQTRQRAILIASLDRHVTPPEATHGRNPQPTLFGDEVLPWVTMADALGLDDEFAYVSTNQDTGPGEDRHPYFRTIDEPSPTIATNGNWAWVKTRPSTTVTGDSRVAPPGHHYGRQYGPGTVKLTLDQALILQSFPPDYPIQGTKTSSFRQVGNAWCPRAAAHVLAAATGGPLPRFTP